MQRRFDKVLLAAERVTAARLKREMTRDDLAKAAGCSRRTVVTIYAGKPISLAKARDVARALGVAVQDLIADGGEAATVPPGVGVAPENWADRLSETWKDVG
jgi:transcriptional regulator with XRE-family HTH domain